MRWLSISLLACWLAVTSGSATQALGSGADARDAGWAQYRNERTGTRADYPAQIFSVDKGPSQRGDGESFSTADSRAQLLIFALPSDPRASPAAFMARALKVPRSAFTYARAAEGFFAVSGFRGDDIYYSRCNRSPGASMFHCMALIYPAHEKRAWDPIVTRMSLSLRPRGG